MVELFLCKKFSFFILYFLHMTNSAGYNAPDTYSGTIQWDNKVENCKRKSKLTKMIGKDAQINESQVSKL